MGISINKLAPSAVVLAFVGYCAWPSVSELASDPQQANAPAKVQELAATLFSPALPPPTTQNPWGGKDAAVLAAAKELAKTADKAAATPADSTSAKAPERPSDPLKGLRLDATCILGDQRLAIINGQLYAPQEKLSSENSSIPPYRIISVFPDKVVLDRNGKAVDLTYSDVASHPASSSQAGAGGKPGAAAGTPLPKNPPAPSTDESAGENDQPSKAGK
jgi:hypothetical protein